jgi:predicted nuclease of restriction endonuclease-like (RecB) superfamily
MSCFLSLREIGNVKRIKGPSHRIKFDQRWYVVCSVFTILSSLYLGELATTQMAKKTSVKFRIIQ